MERRLHKLMECQVILDEYARKVYNAHEENQ